MIVANNKTGAKYHVICTVINKTNANDGQIMYLYTPIEKELQAGELYCREKTEFFEKFRILENETFEQPLLFQNQLKLALTQAALWEETLTFDEKKEYPYTEARQLIVDRVFDKFKNVILQTSQPPLNNASPTTQEISNAACKRYLFEEFREAFIAGGKYVQNIYKQNKEKQQPKENKEPLSEANLFFLKGILKIQKKYINTEQTSENGWLLLQDCSDFLVLYLQKYPDSPESSEYKEALHCCNILLEKHKTNK